MIYKGPPVIEKYESAFFTFFIRAGENEKGKKIKIELSKEHLINICSFGVFSMSKIISPKFRNVEVVKIAAI